MSDTNFSVVADTTDIEVGHSQSVQFNGVDILICHTEEGFFAVEDLCTHSMIPLCGGSADAATWFLLQRGTRRLGQHRQAGRNAKKSA